MIFNFYSSQSKRLPGFVALLDEYIGIVVKMGKGKQIMKHSIMGLLLGLSLIGCASVAQNNPVPTVSASPIGECNINGVNLQRS